MQHRKLSIALTGLLLATSFTANADILFQNLGTATPPSTVGGHVMTPFDQAAQATIADVTDVTIIPGNPFAGDLVISPAANKRTVPNSWNSSWSHGYTGPVFFVNGQATGTFNLPPNTRAFYFYAEPNLYGSPTITATTNSETSSGPVTVTVSPPGGAEGAVGFAFYTTAGETISSITITSSTTNGFAVGEFGISNDSATTCASEGYTGTQLRWCQIICESESSSSTIETYLRRWINRFHDLPYCAVEDEGEEGEGGGEG